MIVLNIYFGDMLKYVI